MQLVQESVLGSISSSSIDCWVILRV